jgi:hypothetical protein
LDFDRMGEEVCLEHVELFPWIDDEPSELVEQVVTAAAELLL